MLAGRGTTGAPLTDAFRSVNVTSPKEQGTRHDFSGDKNGPRIDWILATPEFTPRSASIDHTKEGGRYPSDHFPVTAVLRRSSPLPIARVE
jgi:endonuclease/exonuclease/phosphatase family metal-dependent hydrolase